MFFIAYAFKGQVHVFAEQVKIVSHLSWRTSAILKYFYPYKSFFTHVLGAQKNRLNETHNICFSWEIIFFFDTHS